MNISAEQLAELLAGIAKAQNAIIDAMERANGGWRTTHMSPMLNVAANMRSAEPRLVDLPSRVLMRYQGRPAVDIAAIAADLERLVSGAAPAAAPADASAAMARPAATIAAAPARPAAPAPVALPLAPAPVAPKAVAPAAMAPAAMAPAAVASAAVAPTAVTPTAVAPRAVAPRAVAPAAPRPAPAPAAVATPASGGDDLDFIKST